MIFSFKTMESKLFISILFLSLPFMVLSDKTLDTFTVLQVPALGPESFAFDLDGGGPYTGISDGRIIKYEGPKIGFVEFAYTSPNRTKEKCDGTTDVETTPICGRPFGLGFNYRTKELYIGDAYYGLCKVGPKGGRAEQLVTTAEGGDLKWLEGIDVDQTTEIVYFTDISTKYGFNQMEEAISTGDATGRMISYDPKTKQVKVLMSGLIGPGGVAVSRDSSFVIVPEYTANRIQKYWLKGPKAGTAEILVSIPAPTNVKSTLSNDFWIASNLAVKEPAPANVPRGVKIDASGNILETITLAGIYNNAAITEVNEFEGSYYIGSAFLTFASSTKISKYSESTIQVDDEL